MYKVKRGRSELKLLKVPEKKSTMLMKDTVQKFTKEGNAIVDGYARILSVPKAGILL